MTGVALYSPYKSFPESLLQRTDPPLRVQVNRNVKDVAVQYRLGMQDLAVVLNLMLDAKIPEHLQGFAGYVRTIARGKAERRAEEIVEQIRRTKMVMGVIFEPEMEDVQRHLAMTMAVAEMTKSLMFVRGTLLDYHDNIILAPDGTFDRKAVINPLAPAKPWWKFW